MLQPPLFWSRPKSLTFGAFGIVVGKSISLINVFTQTLLHSDLNDPKFFHSTIDAPPGVPGVSKNSEDQTEVYSGELEC